MSDAQNQNTEQNKPGFIPEETRRFLTETESFLKELANPKEFFQQANSKNISEMDTLLNNFVQQSSTLMSSTFNAISSAWESHSKELAIFHELEAHLVSGSMTDEIWKDISSRLSGLRNEIYSRMLDFKVHVEKLIAARAQTMQQAPTPDTQEKSAS